METLRLLGRPDPARVEHWLDALGIADLAARHPRSLSGGQRQRVAIAAVAVGGADLLLLDEPTRGMDAASRHALEAAIAPHARRRRCRRARDPRRRARGPLCAARPSCSATVRSWPPGPARDVLAGSLFAPQVVRVLPPFLTVEAVAAAPRSGADVTATTLAPRAAARDAAGPRLRARGRRRRGAFLYPFWIPSTALPNAAHAGDAPLVAAIVGALVVATIALEVRRGTMTGGTVAILGVLAAIGGLLRLLGLPGGGNGIYFVIILAGGRVRAAVRRAPRALRDGGVRDRDRRHRTVAPVPDARAGVDGRGRRPARVGDRRPRAPRSRCSCSRPTAGSGRSSTAGS